MPTARATTRRWPTRAGSSATCTAHRARRLPRGDAVAEARRPGAGRRHRRADGAGRRPSPSASATANCASRTTRTCCCPGCARASCSRSGRRPRAAGFATPNIGLITDMIACPGGDFCALANARSIPVAAQITERFADLDEQYDIGDIDLHISGCINSCGHHHSGHIGILGVDKDGAEWYQLTLGGSDGSTASGASVPGKVIGPSFAADEVADAIEAVIDTYRRERASRRALHRHRAPPRRRGLPRRGRRGAAQHRARGLTHGAHGRKTPCDSSTLTATPGMPVGGEDGPPVSITPGALPAARPGAVARRARAHGRPRRRSACAWPTTWTSRPLDADLPRLRAGRAAVPEVGRRPRLQPGPAAAFALPLRGRGARQSARCWSTWCRCSQRTGFDAVAAAPRPVDRRGRARARLLPRPLPGRRARQPAAVRDAARHGRCARVRARRAEFVNAGAAI